jgi:hypothetical protein
MSDRHITPCEEWERADGSGNIAASSDAAATNSDRTGVAEYLFSGAFTPLFSVPVLRNVI